MSLPERGFTEATSCPKGGKEDSNLLAQDRGIPDCHRSLENAVELGRSPGKLNRVAESNCVPWVPNGTGQRCVGRYCVPEPHSLGCWQDGSWDESEEAGRRTLSSLGPENPEEKEIALSLRKWQKQNTGAGCAGSPRSAAVPPRTAGQSPR